MIWLIRIQFFFMFLLTLILCSVLFENQSQKKVLNEEIGRGSWVISPTIKNSKTSNIQWTEEQINWLKEEYADQVGLIYLSKHQEALNQIYVNDVIHKFLVQDGKNPSTELLGYLLNESVESGTKIIEMDTLNNLSGSPLVFLIGVEEAQIQIKTLSNELSELNSGYYYDIRQVIKYKEQKTEINLIYTKSLLFFTTISLLLILTCIISFILLQNQYQVARVNLFRHFGATKRDILKIFILINVYLTGPSYILAVILSMLVGWFLFNAMAWVISFFISIGLLIVILIFMTLPSVTINAKTI
ncbi:ABC transporter permease [Paenibacillus sp. PAMC 26794]|nr:ABC transporter permease [Paenibacillus sp. PAMC 26794]